MSVRQVIYDSTAFQFWGSELYLQDVPLVEGNNVFSPSLLQDWSDQAEQLNREGRGDQAAFLLTAQP